MYAKFAPLFQKAFCRPVSAANLTFPRTLEALLDKPVEAIAFRHSSYDIAGVLYLPSDDEGVLGTFIALTADDEILIGWTPTIQDLQATDWNLT